MTSTELKFVIHGRLKVKLNTVNGTVLRASGSSDRCSTTGRNRSARSLGHTEFGPSRTWRSNAWKSLRKVKRFRTEATLRCTTGKPNCWTGGSTSCGASDYPFCSRVSTLNNRWSSGVNRINRFCVVSEWICSVLVVAVHRSLPSTPGRWGLSLHRNSRRCIVRIEIVSPTIAFIVPESR